jgi:membrane-bound metal-dependent hydrolase YbcI (DUF457 family)
MTGKTHRVGGMLCVLGGFAYLENKGMLLQNVNPVLQLTIMYPFALYGSIFSDLDLNDNVMPSKDIVSVAINKILHLTSNINKNTGESTGVFAVLDAKHRSWQTHSDLFLALLVYGLYKLLTGSYVNSVEAAMVSLVGVGFILGVISHLILDLLNPDGIWSIVLVLVGTVTGRSKKMPKKISLVPKTKFFNTGGAWESGVRGILWTACGILFVYIVYTLIPYRIVFNF